MHPLFFHALSLSFSLSCSSAETLLTYSSQQDQIEHESTALIPKPRLVSPIQTSSALLKSNNKSEALEILQITVSDKFLKLH